MGANGTEERGGQSCNLVPDESLQQAGEALIRLQKRSREWVKRRIEVVRFIDHLTMERETTLDLELSGELFKDFPTLHGHTLLPIKLLRRTPSLNVTVRDAGGNTLPQLNRRDERNLVAAGIVFKCYEGLANAGQLSPDTGLLFKEIRDKIDGREDPPEELPSSEWETIRNSYMGYRLVVPMVDLRPYRDDESKAAILRLVVSYPETLPSPSPRLYRLNQPHEVRKGKPLPYLAQLRAHLATIDDWAVIFEVEQIQDCESFHFEFVAPVGIQVRDDGKLKITTEKKEETVSDSDLYPDRAHFFYQNSEEGEDNAIHEARVELTLRPMTRGVMGGLFLTSLFSMIVLLVLFLTLGLFPNARLYNRDVQSIVTALLLGPTFLSSLMVRDNEHEMTKRILRNMRRRVAVGGVSTFSASLAFALGLSYPLLSVVLMILTVVSAWMTWAGWKSYLRSESQCCIIGLLDRSSPWHSRHTRPGQADMVNKTEGSK